jgi:hypothetical protein
VAIAANTVMGLLSCVSVVVTGSAAVAAAALCPGLAAAGSVLTYRA